MSEPAWIEAREIPHPFPFDPTQGHDVAMLRAVGLPGTEPPGFEAFWRGLRAEAEALPLELGVEERIPPVAGFRLLKVGYNIGRGLRARAWLALPEDAGTIRAGVIAAHGYDGCPSLEPRFFRHGLAVILPVAPGFHISSDPRLPLNDAGRHVVHGIESPETYVLGRCAAAVWQAPSAVEAVLGARITRWHYFGWSFGGGLGALALPWEPRVQSAELGQPTFGHHPLRLQQPSNGSANAVRERFHEDPSIARTLAFFDAATAATRLRIPVVFACSLFDPAVTPPGQFAVANAHPGPKRISVFRTGHFDRPGGNVVREMRAHHRNIAGLIGPEFII
jgi:cephalosporin-C deacetylase